MIFGQRQEKRPYPGSSARNGKRQGPYTIRVIGQQSLSLAEKVELRKQKMEAQMNRDNRARRSH